MMKGFIGFMLAVALLALAGIQTVQAQARQFAADDVVIAAGAVTATDTDVLGAKIGFGDPFAVVKRITVSNGSDTNAVAVFYAVDAGVETEIARSGTLTPGASEVLWPERSVSRTVVESVRVVTNNVVLALSTTNTVTHYEKYPVRDFKMWVTQDVSRTSAKTVKWAVFAE
jgi:hypothetical protein